MNRLISIGLQHGAQPGSNVFVEAGEVVKVFIDDIRMINVEVKQIELRSCAASKPKYELPAGTKIEILKLMAVNFKPPQRTGTPKACNIPEVH